MSTDLAALVAGTLLAVGALAFVLYPLFFEVREPRRRRAVEPRDTPAGDASAIVALREIEFDRATGKLSESDYAELKQSYTARALRELRQREGDASASVPVDAIEARLRSLRATHRECLTCGVRPEPDAVYCSTCGTFLDRTCATCAAAITEPGATFCSSCGSSLVSTKLAGASV